jgi:CBS domain-containing protein
VLDGNQLVGIVTLEDIRRVPREEWNTRLVQEIMTPERDLVVASPEEDASKALNKLMERDVRQLPVTHAGQLVGLLRRRDIMRWLQLQSGKIA